MYNQGNYQQFGQRLPPLSPFQQGPPPPPPPYGPPVSVPSSGMLTSSQSFLIPSPPPPTAQQGSNWSQSQHHIPPPIGHHLPPPPPPPHPQGQHFYRVPLPLPPPLSSSYFTPAPFGSFVQPAHESSMGHLPPPPSPPPPPPSSPPPGPPPLPPSSPPPNSPLHPSSASPSTLSKLSSGSSKPSDVEMVASGVIDRSNDTPRHVDGSEVGVKDISDPDIMADTHLPPPRPSDEKTVRKIEVLCQYIAKNGDEFEDMTCQKEVGNPEFEFLFGGAPGSEAAISHEYFKWMKKKCSSSELLDGRQNSGVSLRPSGFGSSLQRDGAMHAGISCSPAGSDMDMEDDITQPEETGIGKSFGGANHKPAFISNEVDIKLEEQKCDSEHISPKDAKNENLFHSGSSGVVEQGANLDQDNAQFEKSFMRDSDADPEKHDMNLHQHANQSGPEVSSSEIPSDLIKGTSPFRLIQDYASDDSSENDNDPHLENVSPEPVSPHVQTTTQDLDLTPLSPSVVKDSLNASEIPEPSKWKEDLDNNRTDSYRIMVKQDDRLASPKNGGSQMKDGNNKLEVDEFGRMVKAGARDSDSDDYTRRRGKRGRSRSRSRSPYERRRRSPRRWREKRSRSHSWSPKKRTRSRSPYREAGGDWTRRDRNRIQVCLDFQRGKCFRGELCRYVHDSNNNDEYTRHKNKQHHQEAPHILKTSNKLSHENEETKFDQEEFIEPATHGADNTTNQQQQPDHSGPSLQNPEEPLHQNDQILPFPPQLYNVTPTSKYPPSEIYPKLAIPSASTWNPLPLPPPPPLPPQYRHNLLPPPQINYPSQPFPMPYQPPPQIIQSFSGENLPAGRIQSFPSENLPPSGRLPLPQYSLPGVPDFGIPRIMTHYNPYASTFDQPLSTKFSSSVFTQGVRSTNMNTSPSSTHYFTHNQATSGGAQYDPLFDSIDPSSNSFKKTDLNNNNIKIEETSNSNRLVMSLENDEFGETADAEVGAVENDSPSSPIDLADVATGEVEIDQVKNSSGKNKKIKDSRSMKLFKVALADFVKEVLKPSWRQGNMSKEAFKTIVKKTVDKVSGAMKKHQLPKSQAKINQYIDSSQRKLTKLVMGYVDKYVKV